MTARKTTSKAQHRITMHNAYSGWVTRMQNQLSAMLKADSLTPDARLHATGAAESLHMLVGALKTRVDPK